MKKGLILMLAALMLAVSLTACAATQPYYDGYSNVSTTRNGYVNGTNGYGGVYNGTNYNPGYNGAGYSQSGTATGRTVTGSTSGTVVRRISSRTSWSRAGLTKWATRAACVRRSRRDSWRRRRIANVPARALCTSCGSCCPGGGSGWRRCGPCFRAAASAVSG